MADVWRARARVWALAGMTWHEAAAQPARQPLVAWRVRHTQLIASTGKTFARLRACVYVGRGGGSTHNHAMLCVCLLPHQDEAQQYKA